MNLVDPPEAYGYTIFCDDIRTEVGGKVTYVGCYAAPRMFIATPFPVTLPKLAMAVYYFQKRDKVILPITFWIFLPGDADDKPSIVAGIAPESAEQVIREGEETAKKLGIENVYGATLAQFSLVGTVIQKPGPIKVRAVRGDSLIRLGAIDIMPPEGYATQPATSLDAGPDVPS
jgi:hypothetical protein